MILQQAKQPAIPSQSEVITWLQHVLPREFSPWVLVYIMVGRVEA